MSLSKNQLKLITGLTQKKYRNKHNLFVVEGIKVVDEFLGTDLVLKHLFFTEASSLYDQLDKSQLISERDLSRISCLKTPNKVLAVFEIPEMDRLKDSGLIIALDCINDPGNLGAIIRLCDWFGVDQLVCSENTVDCYNPKVVQASMGSLTRVSVVYTNLEEYLKNSKLKIVGADMNGSNIYTQKLPINSVLVMGNEANGISEKIGACIENWVKIPRVGQNNSTESLNVATATAILLSELRRSASGMQI